MTIPTKEEVAKLYVATFNRAPDEGGLNYWVYNSGLSLAGIAQSFFDQPETQGLYPPGTSNRDFIKSVYANLFNREPDTAGWNYWENELNGGAYSKNLFIQTVINGAQDSSDGLDRAILQNKTEVGLYYADNRLSDVFDASRVMQGVSADTTTVDVAKAMIDELVSDSGFMFTENWLNGRTVYNVWDDDDNGLLNDIMRLEFNDGEFTDTSLDNTENNEGSYSILENGFLRLDFSFGDRDYIKGFQESTDLNALSIVWDNNYVDVDVTYEQAIADHDIEYIFFDLESAETFINNQVKDASYIFTSDWLNGRTFYNVWDDDDNGTITDLERLEFNNGQFSATGLPNDDESYNGSYSILDNSIIQLNLGNGEIDYIRGLQLKTNENLLEIAWEDDYEYITSATQEELYDDHDVEYAFFNIESAQTFIDEQLQSPDIII